MLVRSRRLAPTLVVAASLSLAAACGGSSSGGGDNAAVTPQSSVDSALAAKVPASVKSDGVMTIGMDTTYAPNDFLASDGHTAVGWEVELFDAIVAKLGLKPKYVSAPFGTIIPSIDSGKFDMGVSSFSVNSDREKQVTMVSYYNVGIQWVTQKGNPSGIAIDNACGKRVAVQKDTIEVDDLTARSKKCTSAGKSKITIDQYVDQADATNAAISGKDDGMLADYPISVYAVQKTNGQLQLLGSPYSASPYGTASPKNEPGLAQALQGAIKDVIVDGTYKKILDKWHVAGGAISTPEINPTVG